MTKLTREAIAVLSGRELDAAVAEKVFGWNGIGQWTGDEPADDHDWVGCPPNAMRDYFAGKREASFEYLPFHSHPDCRGLAAMVEKAREAGWYYRLWNGGSDSKDKAELHRGQGERVIAVGSHIPEAFARALLLTTIPPETS